jgi:integrase/recombinase XerD
MSDSSVLEWVEEYLAFRRGLGFSLTTPAWYLRSFARYAEQARHRGPLTLDLVTRWALASRSQDPAQAARRLGTVRSFARHRALLDPATEVPPIGLLGRIPRRKQPHIYTDTEIRALLRQAAQMLPRGGLRPRTYITYFSLLFSTGLRLSEACRLTCGDLDLGQGLLMIRGTKFRKSRWVPLHPSVTRALTRYAADRDAVVRSERSSFFFRVEHIPRLTTAAVEKAFSRMRRRLCWSAQGRARRPRIHDARHTFTVRRLLRWYEEEADIGQKILALSTYLGHAKVTDTYWYLTGVPELMTIASQRFERLVQQRPESAS